MSDLSDAIKVITSLTPSKAAWLAVIMLFLIGMVVAYEIQTSQFQLERLSNVTELVTEVAPLVQSENAQVQELAQKILIDLTLIMDQDTSVSQTPIDPRILLIILLSTPWVIMSFVGIGEAFQGVSDWYYGTIGCVAFSLVFAFIGYSIPIDIHWFYRYVCFPLILLGVSFYIFWVVGDSEDD